MSNKITEIPISRPAFFGREIDEIEKTIKSGWIMQGPRVEEFENRVADYVGARYAIAVSSGTTALHLALLSSGIQKGDEIIVPSYSFIASANSILYAGAKPEFVEIDPDTFNLDPDKIPQHITKKTKAIMVVHQFGLSADMDRINKIADKYGLKIIEDAACALGSSYKNKKIGAISRIACFSFHPRKIITTGEGGIITTSSREMADKIRILRSHGLKGNKGVMLGYNYRMTDLQAVIGISQMKYLDRVICDRRKKANYYNSLIESTGYIEPPFIPPYAKTNFQSYVVKIKGVQAQKIRSAVEGLNKNGIHVKLANMAIHKQPYYARKFGRKKLKITEYIADIALSLPLFYGLSEKEQDLVVAMLTKYIPYGKK